MRESVSVRAWRELVCNLYMMPNKSAWCERGGEGRVDDTVFGDNTTRTLVRWWRREFVKVNTGSSVSRHMISLDTNKRCRGMNGKVCDRTATRHTTGADKNNVPVLGSVCHWRCRLFCEVDQKCVFMGMWDRVQVLVCVCVCVCVCVRAHVCACVCVCVCKHDARVDSCLKQITGTDVSV